MRHSLEALDLELFEEGEQLIVRPVAFWSAFDGVDFGQGLFLQCQVGIEIDLRRERPCKARTPHHARSGYACSIYRTFPSVYSPVAPPNRPADVDALIRSRLP